MKKLTLLLATLLIAQSSFAWVIQFANPTNASYSNCNDGKLHVQVWGTSIDIFYIKATGPNGYQDIYKAPDNFGSSYFSVNFNGLAPGVWHIEVWKAGPFCQYNLPGEYNDVWRTVGANITSTTPTIVSQTPATGNCSNGSITLSNGQTIDNLAAGYHTYYYSCGCSGSNNFTYYIGQETCFTAYTTHTDLTAPGTYGCANGRIRVDVSTDQNYRVELQGAASAVTNFYGHFYEFENLPEGNYTVIIRNMDLIDPNCCLLQLNDTIGATPCNTAFTTVSTPSDLGCNNGKAELNITSQSNFLDYYCVTIAGVSNGYWMQHAPTMNTTILFENVPPDDYEVTVQEHRFGGTACYCQTSDFVTVSENTCPEVTVVSINPQDDCGPSNITLSNGDVFTQLTPGPHTLTSTTTCGCDTIPYSVEVDVPPSVCNFTVSAVVEYVNECNATITGTVNNTNCGAIVMLWQTKNPGPDPFMQVAVGPNGSFSFEHLTNGKYVVQIKSLYSDFYCNTSTYELNITGVTCLPPNNESAAMVNNKKVLLTWDTVACAEGYIIRYKPTSSSAYKTKELNGNVGQTTIGSLLSNTNYDWSIKTKCATGKKSVFGNTYSFCVGNNCLGAKTASITNNLENELKVFPNPATNVLQIKWPDLAPGNIHLIITNNMGQIVLSKPLNVNGLDEKSINIENFENGMYQLNVTTNNKNYSTRFVVAR